MRQYFVYMLKCKDGSYYTSITNDVERRMEEHQQGISTNAYTYTRGPVKLMFFERFKNPNEAIAFEKQIKGWSRKKKEAMIENNWYQLKELSVCQNESHHRNHNSY